MEIINTQWARDFENEAPLSFIDALRIFNDKPLKVCTYQTDESGDPNGLLMQVI